MKVKDLSNDRLREIIEEYYQNKFTVKILLEKHGVKYISNFIQTATLYCDEECEICGSKMKYKLESRAYCSSISELKKICSVCGHDGTKNCYCKSCIQHRKLEKEKELEEKRSFLKKVLEVELVSLDKLSAKELIFVGVLQEKGIGGYDLGVLAQKDYFKNTHTYPEDSFNFIIELLRNNVIKINVNESNLEHFILKENKSVSYYPALLSYYLNLNEDINSIDVRKEIIERFKIGDIEECWVEICLDECMKYLDIRTTAMELGIIDNPIKSDIYSFLQELLMEYSVGRVINVIYKSVNYASNFKVEYDVEVEKAHKAIYTNIKNNIAKGYIKEPFDRPYELVQNSLSEYFCKNIFKRDSNEVFKQGFSINELYCIEEEGQQQKDEIDPIKEGLETYNKLVLQIKELIANNVPKDFIISYLKITEEIYNSAVGENNDNC
ncbi:hypothetical protein [Clostridium algidicarnis]|uniref:hypothetical protein n=1 Tax=Clostridium algidicarnis TaxID=37659 RepID=UPI0016236526|nr:hypothetical protein [Clostridium algidicarnis]MBB6698529.1 hypothetical protein [Clostridium algidicarnis]